MPARGAGLEALEASAGLRLKGSAQVNPTGLIPQLCWGRNQCSLVPQDHSSAPRPSPKASSMKPDPCGCSAGLWTISSSLGFCVLSLDPLDLTRSSPPEFMTKEGMHTSRPQAALHVFGKVGQLLPGPCPQTDKQTPRSCPGQGKGASTTYGRPASRAPASFVLPPLPQGLPSPSMVPAQAISLSATRDCLPPLLRAHPHRDPLPSPAPCILTDSDCQS